MTSIRPIEQPNIFRVNPVQINERQQENSQRSNIFDTSLFARQDNDKFNLNHPKVRGSETQAKNLDLLA